jgi:hypothetical protein
MSPKVAKVEDVPVDKIVPNPWNPNIMSEEAYDRLLKEITDVGFIDFPQVVPMEDGMFQILGGEHRVRAGKELGMETIPCIILSDEQWSDEDLRKLVTVRLNALHGKIDPTRMAELYTEMAKRYGAEALREVFAFTDKSEWSRLLKSINKAVVEAKIDPEAAKEFKKRAQEARTVDDLTRILQQLFAHYGDTVDLSFMVFTFGNKDHVYVNMSPDTHRALKKVTKHCKTNSENINDVLGVAIQALAETLHEDKKRKKKAKPTADTDVKF